jgi:hypothetical protein
LNHRTLLLCALFPSAATANTIAITEFLNNVAGDENTEEWIELYNYGTGPVNVTGWTITDSGGTVATLPSITIPSDRYVVLAADTAAFIAAWGVGTTGADLHDVPFGSLGNSDDDLTLADSRGVVRWRLGWADDESSGNATFLQGNRFSLTDFGDASSPGIVRDGYDLGGARVVGYESNSAEDDAFGWTANTGDFGSPLTGHYAPPALEQTSRATIAITEVMHSSRNTGADYDGDWVELYNYGGLNVNLSGFVLRDGYAADDSYVLPAGTILPPDGYLILTRDPAAFEATWQVGVAGATILGDISFPGLASEDDLELLDANGAFVWSVSWDDTTQWSDWPTHYVLNRVLGTDWGRIGWRDVVYGALDAAGTTGYENGGQATDYSAFLGGADTASPLAGVWTENQPTSSVRVVGACPGPVTLQLSGFTPRANVALAKSSTTGSFGPTRGACAFEISWLGTAGLSVIGTFRMDNTGAASIPATLPAPACGAFLQGLELSTCTFSNLGQVPWN